MEIVYFNRAVNLGTYTPTLFCVRQACDDNLRLRQKNTRMDEERICNCCRRRFPLEWLYVCDKCNLWETYFEDVKYLFMDKEEERRKRRREEEEDEKTKTYFSWLFPKEKR